MEQCVGILFLLTALIPIAQSDLRIFSVIDSEMTWSDARAYCQAHFVELVSIKSGLDTAMIQTLLSTYGISTGAWIGLYNPQSWRWSMGNSPLGSFTSWDITEPNNNGGNELCAAMYWAGWWDTLCDSTFPFVCFDETKTGDNRYILIPDGKNWTQAQSYCRANHTDLVSIRDAAEFSTVVNIISGDVWVGLHKDDWKWIDTTNMFPITWDLNQPDNYLGNESCGDIYNGSVADENCTDLRPAICYTYPRHVQLIQLKVKSNQHVNEPALKAAIMDKIKQMFMMHGFPSTTKVTWKIHQDGVVFKKLV